LRRKAAARCECKSGVAPPCGAATSQKKPTTEGGASHCAISWWKGMRSEGGASLAVNTLGATAKRGPAEHSIAVTGSSSIVMSAEKWAAVGGLHPRSRTAPCVRTRVRIS